MTTYLWSALTDGQVIAFDPLVDVIQFDDSSISAGDRSIIYALESGWELRVFDNANPALNKIVTIVSGTAYQGFRQITDTNVVFANGSTLLIGDNTTGTAGDDAANTLTGTSGSDRFLGLRGDDTLNGGAGNDVFVLNSGSQPFGADVVAGGSGFDWIGVGFHETVTAGSVVNFDTHAVTSALGSATFTSIEHGFGSIHADTFYAYESARTYTGTTADYFRLLDGYDGDDRFEGDNRPGVLEMVRYLSAPSGVVVKLEEGYALDGYGDRDTLIAINGVRGSPYDDTLIGGGTALSGSGRSFEVFEGMAGDDLLDGNGTEFARAEYSQSPAAVNVNLQTGTASDGWGGTDTLVNINLVRGSRFGDTLTGDDADNQLEGMGDNDTINGGGGSDMAVFLAATGAVTADLQAGTASGAGIGTDTLISIESLRGGDFNDTLSGDGNDNVLDGRMGNDTLDGRSGHDSVTYASAPVAVTVNLATATASDGWGTTDTLVAIEGATGSLFADNIAGDGGDNTLRGWGGDDTLAAGNGKDTLEGGLGNDSLDGGAGDDYFDDADGSNTLSGGDGDDYFTVAVSVGGATTATGGAGSDFYFLDPGSPALGSGSSGQSYVITDFETGGGGDELYVVSFLALATTYAGGDPVAAGFLRLMQSGADTLLQADRDGAAGGAYDWTTIVTLQNVDAGSITDNNLPGVIFGTDDDDELEGGDDDDVIFGEGGDDTCSGGDGDDTLNGGPGNDTLDGGNGTDTADYATAVGAVTVDLDSGTASGADGSDTLIAIENVRGGAFGDTLVGNSGENALDGGGGADTLSGGAANDLYYVDNALDVVTEIPNEISLASGLAAPLDQAVLDGFIDTVVAAINYSLENVAYVENVTLAAVSAATSATGNELDNVLTGNALDNTLTGSGGNDTLDGGAGLDVAIFDGNRASYTIGAGGTGVSGPDGTDTLSNIERLQFADEDLAFDLGAGEAAGNTVRIIGAALGKENIAAQPDWVGIGLDLFDSGMSLPEVCQLVIGVLGNPSNEAFVATVYENVVGAPPAPAELAFYVGLLQGSGGTMTQAQLLEIAVNSPLTAESIDLAGLQQSGVEFV